MRVSLRWKLTLSFAVMFAACLGLLYAYLHGAVRLAETHQLEERLLGEAALASDSTPSLSAPGGALARWADDLDARLDTRVTVIAPDGTVVADSRESAAVMGNHADRPERLQALSTGRGVAVRFSSTLGMDMLYAAVAVGDPAAQPRPVLRLARPLVEVYAAQAHLQRMMLLACLGAVLLTWPLGWLLAHHLTQPVSALVRVGRRVAKGDLQARVEPLPEPELAELGATLNTALDALSRLLDTSQRESRYYSAILSQMTDAVVVVDRTGRVQFVNAAFARLFGVPEEAALGRSSEQIALNYDLSALLARAMEQGAAQHDELRVLRPEARSLAAVVTPLQDGGQAAGAIALLHDVTDLRRSDEIRREFVANASHELRTPAAGIKALAEALQMGAAQDPEKGPRFVQQIVTAADRLTAILDDMLVLTRVERGWQLLKPEWVPVAAAVQEAGEQLRLRAEARGLTLRTEVADGDTVFADPEGLRTVLLNLLDNAVKYTPEGGTVSARGRQTRGGYELSVTDTGVGIPAEHLTRIFERFYRVDKARDRATGGTGLGLSIVKHIVESHGGRVTVQSLPGQGSTFTCFLPAPAEAGGPAAPTP